ncbi:MAG: thioredoxin family protein [Micrococcus sp.]|nr:thioredoxin family protein [Micrococcus sp.]
MMRELTLATLAATVESNATVIVDFWAPWCTTCLRFSPIFTDVAQQFDDVIFATVNTDEEQELAGIMGVRSLPTLVGFRNGKHVFAKSGLTTRRQLGEIIDEIRTLTPEQE